MAHQDIEYAIVGAGFAGMAMAVELQNANLGGWKIFEGADDIGGTWRENTYPGCACDVPSTLYSLSYDPNARWSRSYGPQSEILEYMKASCEKFGLTDRIQFNTWIISARFDETTQRWTLKTSAGDTIGCKMVIFGVGGLSKPKIPEFEGVAEYQGETWHSARWNHDVDLHGKRVAVVGTGASAIQFVPEVAKAAKALDVYQRTPPWCIPKLDRPVGEWQKGLFEKVPAARWMHRTSVYWLMELWGSGFALDPRLMKLTEWRARRFIRENFPDDPEMQEKLTPDYSMGCKRVLFTNDYYPALARPNVELLTDGIDRFTAQGIRDQNGKEREYDVVIYGTGFHVTDGMADFRITGRDGEDLNARWSDGMEAYLGVSIAGFPNYFMMMGPNTGLGHSSVIFMIEAQAHYIRKLIERTQAENAGAIEVRPEAMRAYNEEIQRRLKKTIWLSGCQSWYLQEDGKNTTLWPGYTWEYWLKTRTPDADAFRLSWS